jgi:pimeloyl-ACP methyl ester carboxylesterase
MNYIPLTLLLLPHIALAVSFDYFDTSFLSNYPLVEKTLIEQEGFKEVWFPAQDGVHLNGLLRLIPNASASVVISVGFYPGRKEGMASLIKMLPTDYNILFFDARGHGKSKGRFFSSLLYNYGIHEHKDILGAITYVHSQSTAPIILYGLCIGGFHTLHAAVYLTEHDLLDHYNIKGLVCDSTLYSLGNALNVPKEHVKNSILPRFFKKIYPQKTKKEIKQTYLYKVTSYIIASISTVGTFFLKPIYRYQEDKTNILTKIHRIPVPIFFIHSHDDSYAPVEQAYQLASKCHRAQCWWIVRTSSHAAHHLKHTEEYTARLLAFLQHALNTE